MVAHTPLKTPTAVAAWLVDRMARIEGWLEEMTTQLASLATAVTKAQELKLEQFKSELRIQASTYCQRSEARLALIREQLISLIERRLEREQSRLEVAERSVEALSPQRIMELGFAVIRLGGKTLKSVVDAQPGEKVEIELKDGVIKARVE